jgi:aspartate racemase
MSGVRAKHIGIFTMSYEGAALCYQTICAEAAAVMGEHLHPEITLHSFPLAQYMRFVSELDWDGVAGLLLESVEKVARAGADFAICPANTAHEAFELLLARSPIPCLHIVEVVAEAARDRSCSRLGVLGTRFLMEGKVYREVLNRRGIEVAVPAPDQRSRINALIYDELVKGIVTASTREYFRAAVNELTSSGCDGVVLGCTEIPLVLGERDVEVPLFDSTRLLAKAALREALREA